VGRTGTFIAVDRLLQDLLSNPERNHKVDIFGMVAEMRLHRTKMVQKSCQYKCIHECLLLALNEMGINEEDPDGVRRWCAAGDPDGVRRGTDELAVRRARRKRSGDHPDKKEDPVKLEIEEEGNGLELVVEEEEDEDEGIGDFEEDEAVEMESEQGGNNGREGGK